MASRTRGSVGVVACMSKYIGRVPSSMMVACLRIPAAGLIIASPDMPNPGILTFSGKLPVCAVKAFWSALTVVSTLTSALSGLEGET